LPQFEESEKWLYSYVLIEIGKVLSEIKMWIRETCVKKREFFIGIEYIIYNKKELIYCIFLKEWLNVRNWKIKVKENH
jgi:hypothetical protein